MRYRFITGVLAVLLMAALARGLRAASLANRVPAHALAFVGWSGPPKGWAGYDQSRLRQILAHSGFKAFYHQYLPELIQAMGRSNPQSGARGMQIFTEINSILAHPCAFYLDGFYNTGAGAAAKPMPRAGLIIQTAGHNPNQLLQPLVKLAAMVNAGNQGQDPPFKAEIDGKYVCLWIGIPTAQMRSLLTSAGNAKDTLAGSPKFVAAMQQVGGGGGEQAWLDVHRTMKAVDSMITAGGDKTVIRNWALVKKATGLGRCGPLAATARFADGNWRVDAFLGCGERAVAANPMRGSEVPFLLAQTPASATAFTILPVNLGAMYKGVRTLVSAMPGGAAQFKQGVQGVNAMLGMDIGKDFIDAFGPDWLAYQDPGLGGNGPLGEVCINQPAHPRRLGQAIAKIGQMACMMIDARSHMTGTPMYLRVVKSSFGDVTLHDIAAPVVTPTWAIWKGTLYLGLYPQTVLAAIQARKAGAAGIETNARFRGLQKRLGNVANPAALSYIDLQATARQGYGSVLLMSRALLGLADMYTAAPPAPTLVIPTLPDLESQLDAAGEVTWRDGMGWHWRSTEPFPGSMALAAGNMGGIGDSSSIGTYSMMVAILLPSLARAKTLANRAVSSANERSIIEGCVIYAQSHHNKLPPNLATLIAEGLVTPKALIDPQSGNQPANLAQLPAAEWHNVKAIAGLLKGHCDYVYVGAGMTADVGSQDVLVYEKPGINSGQGCNVGFGDGHVAWLSASELPMVFNQANGLRKQAGLAPIRYQK